MMSFYQKVAVKLCFPVLLLLFCCTVTFILLMLSIAFEFHTSYCFTVVMQVSGREVFEFRPELVDDDDEEADDTKYFNDDDYEDEVLDDVSISTTVYP